jgi:hypothetical protein
MGTIHIAWHGMARSLVSVLAGYPGVQDVINLTQLK